MKKFYLSMLTVLTLLLGATSCSQEEGYEKPSSNVTSFSVSLNDVVGSRTIGEGTLADILYYEVFMGQTSVHKGYKKEFTSGTNIDLPLLNGETYQIVFWAQNSGCKIYELSDLSKISIDYDALQTDGKLLANQDSYDAFYNALVDFQADGNTHKVELRRPFAQLNLGTTDWGTLIDALPANEVPVEVSSVTVDGLANAFYPLTGAAVANSNTSIQATFAYNQIPNAEFEVNGTKYKYLSLNYLLVPGQKDPQGEEDYVADTNEDKAIVDLTFNLKRGNTELRPISVPNAPMQRNWRTNIIGAVLTGTSFDITIEPATDGDNQDIRNIDGVDDLIDAMEANGDSENSVTYYVNGLSTLDEVSVAIPSTFKANDVTFIFNNIKNGANLEIKDAELAHKYAGSVYVKLPNLNETGKSLTKTKIDLGGAHVELLVGNFGETTAATDDLTLVVGPNATIGALVVEKGNVEIQSGGSVETIAKSNDNQEEVKVTLGVDVKAPEVVGYEEDFSFTDTNNNQYVSVGVGLGEDGNYYISNAEGLKWLATTINGGDKFDGKTIMLAADIDLNNELWISAGTEEHPFSGTFDGDGKTIMNLSVIESEAKEGKAFIGLFGYAKDATIKNVTFENVNLDIACLDIDHSQGHIGAVAGSLEGTSTIENVTVKGDIKVCATQDANGASRVAVIAGGNSYGNVTMKNVHVIANEGSYLIANNNTGALAGQLQGKSVFENCSSNIDVTVNKFFAGGIIGLAAGDQTFTNCQTTGNIAVVAGREGRAHDHYRVGGIAGGWADGAKNVLTITNCSYTGQISGKNADGSVAEAFDYAGYVGRGYTLNGCQGSKVVIDGVEYVQAFNTAAEAGIYYVDGTLTINSASNLKLFAQKVNGGESFQGETIQLGANIDLKNEQWYPIGKDNTFDGIFDGKDYTISNLKYYNEKSDWAVGLFGCSNNATFKNFTLNNVDFNVVLTDEEDWGHIGSVVGYAAGTTVIEKIKLTGDVKIVSSEDKRGSGRIGGIIGGNSGNFTIKDVTVNANEGSYVKGSSSIGGIAGQLQGEITFENCSTNINVSAQQFYAGGIIGLAANKTTFTNCSTSGNISVLAGRAGNANDLYRVGGIAGGWDDNVDNPLVLTGCSYTGVLSGKSADEKTATAFDCDGFVGRGYSVVVGAKVNVNGVEYEYAGDGIYKVGDNYVVNTGDALVAALGKGYNVTFGGDLKINPANMSNAYGKTGVLVYDGQTIDGSGYKLDIAGAGGTWDSGICTSGGLIKNLWVTGSFRGIFVKGADHIEKVVLDNVRVEGTTYTISIDQASKQGLEATNSIFRGWTSYAATIGNVKFTKCTFGAGNGYNFSRPYAPTEYVNCNFEEGHEMDPRAAVTFENCTINGVALTADNLATLVTSNIANASVK